MATVKELLDTAVRDGRKIEAIKMARESGIEEFHGTYNGRWIDHPGLGCQRQHSYDTDFGKWGHTYEAPGSYDYECHAVLNLIDAKNAVEALMAKATSQDEIVALRNRVADLEADLAWERNRTDRLRLDDRLNTALDDRDAAERELAEERRMARQNEQRLGKALKQIVGLKEKVEDRNSRLKDLARQNQELELLVRQYEHVISQRAIRQERELEFYG